MANITSTWFQGHRRENDFHTLYNFTDYGGGNTSIPDNYIRFFFADFRFADDYSYKYEIVFNDTDVHVGQDFSPYNQYRNNNKAGTPTGGVGSYANAPGWPRDMNTYVNNPTSVPEFIAWGQGAIENTYLGICDHSGTSKCHAYIGTFQDATIDFYDDFYVQTSYFYSLKIAGAPPQASKTIRFDEDQFENSIQRYNSDTSQPFMKYRFTIYDSDAYFQGVTSSTAGFINYGSYNPVNNPSHLGPVLKTRHESGNNEQMRDADRIRLIVNNTGTIKYKFARYNSGDNYRILFYLNGSGNATIIQNNSNNSEQTSTVTLSAGTYTVCWQKGSGAPNASCRVMITGEDP